MKEDRLIIKNFGPIKHIDIPIRKINVLIGDQGTGKSTVAKVLTCLLSIDFILLHKTKSINYFKSFKLDNYLTTTTFIKLLYSDLEIKYEKKQFSLKDSSKVNNENLQEKSKPNNLSEFIDFITKTTDGLSSIDKTEILQNIKGAFYNMPSLSNYIPAERNILTSFANSPFSYLKSGVEFSDYLLSFGEKYDIARKDNSKLRIEDFGVIYEHIHTLDYVTIKNKKLLLNESASGIQNIVPIYLILEAQKHKPIAINIIEEPEISLFPKSQNKLTQFLCLNALSTNSDLLITTHSPYILTTINNLMYAYKVSELKNKKVSVSKIIDKKYWVNPKDVSAYILNEKGEAEDLMDYEINQMQAERIDEISSKINDEYDKLNDIFWAKE